MEEQDGETTKNSIRSRFLNACCSQNKALELIEDLLNRQEYGLLKIIGKDAYKLIPITRDTLKALAEANALELIKEVFESQKRRQERIVQHLVSLRALPVLKIIGEDVYKLVPINEQFVKALVKVFDPELIKRVFEAMNSESKETFVRLL